MAYSTISKPSLHFNTKLYTGNGSAGHSITGVGFQPDFVWIKQRDSRDHFLFNAISTATKYVASNTTAAEATDANTLTAFGADGFTLGSGVGVNENNDTHVSWNWKANGQGSSNTDGSINTTATSVNTTAGFSISTYTGTGSAGATIGHGLGVVPKMILVKVTSTSNNWGVYHASLGGGSNPQNKYLVLDGTSAEADATTLWNDTAPTNQVFSVGSGGMTNSSGATYVAYCFAEKKGYSKFGSYTGNGNANGPMIYTGFKPAFIIIKKTSAIQSWTIQDNKRNPINNGGDMKALKADTSGAEEDEASHRIDYLSNGFKMRYNWEGNNQSGGTYIYMAFAAEPLVANVGSSIPATAR